MGLAGFMRKKDKKNSDKVVKKKESSKRADKQKNQKNADGKMNKNYTDVNTMDKGLSRIYPVVLITGTPGTGKSKVLEHFSSVAQGINVSDLIKQNSLHDGYDSEFDTYIVNDKKTRTFLLKRIKELRLSGPVLVECHSCGIFDHDRMEGLIDAVIVLTCSTESLYDRLEARGYSKKKLDENMECEIMGVCGEEAREVFRSAPVVEMKNSEKDDFTSITEYIQTFLKSSKKSS